jgi:hypothetical protein
MGSVRTRKGSNKLFIDFRYRGERCRELTALNDVAAYRKKLDNNTHCFTIIHTTNVLLPHLK